MKRMVHYVAFVLCGSTSLVYVLYVVYQLVFVYAW
jgi:hypothetical protein